MDNIVNGQVDNVKKFNVHRQVILVYFGIINVFKVQQHVQILQVVIKLQIKVIVIQHIIYKI